MYPHNHVFSSMIAVSLAAYLMHVTQETFFFWLAVAALSALIDLDHLLIALLWKERRKTVFEVLTHPVKTILCLREFRNKIHFRGLGYYRLASHIILSASACWLSYVYVNTLFTPTFVSLAAHIMLDAADTWIDPGNR